MFVSLSQQPQKDESSLPSSSNSSSPISWSEEDRPTGYPITGQSNKDNSSHGPIAVIDVSCDDISKKIEACMVSPSKSNALNTCDDTIKFYCNMCMKS